MKPTEIRAVRPNIGVGMAYKLELDALINEMAASVAYWVQAEWRKYPTLALDAYVSPARKLNVTIQVLQERWVARFGKTAEAIANRFARRNFAHARASLKDAMSVAGISVQFKDTARIRDTYEAVIAENVSLIKSIPQQFLAKVEGDVMRAVSSGGDLKTLATSLREEYGLTKKRAALIARDQNRKATAVIHRDSLLDLGVTQAVWHHSHAGKTPRPSHVAANGKVYELSKGLLVEGEYIQPGQEINCRCTCRAIVPNVAV